MEGEEQEQSEQARHQCANCYSKLIFRKGRSKKFNEFLYASKENVALSNNSNKHYGKAVTVLEALDLLFDLKVKALSSDIRLCEDYIFCYSCVSSLTKLHTLFLEFTVASKSPSFMKSIFNQYGVLNEFKNVIREVKLERTEKPIELMEDVDPPDDDLEEPAVETSEDSKNVDTSPSTVEVESKRNAPNHAKPDEILCPDCGDLFRTFSKLKKHKELKHSKEISVNIDIVTRRQEKRTRTLKCKECPKVFNHKNSLVYHMKAHTGERNHECSDCGKTFLTSSALNVHNRLHTGEKPYACEHCDKRFRQWGDLAYHMVSLHSNVRAYVCEFCGKDFARKYSLTVHRRIHTEERDYSCDFCSKSFRAASYLQSHRRIHTGEKPHDCDVCGKPFRVKSDMKRHRQSHTRHNNSDTPKSKPLCPKVKKEATSALTGTAAPSGAGTSIQMRIKPNTATIGTPNPKVQVEDDLIVHNLVAVDESGQIIELEPQLAQQLRAGQVIQVPLPSPSGGTSTSQRITIENADGSIITGDLEHTTTSQGGDEEIKEEGQMPVQYLQHADLVLSSEQQDVSQGSLYVWPVFMS